MIAYTPAFLRALQFILPHEDEYARGHWGDPNFVVAENVDGDSGGVTKYGIDQASHPEVKVADLTYDQAVAIYWQEWLLHRLDLLPANLAIALFDVYVNGGHPIEWLQIALNALEFLGTPVDVDDHLGPQTLGVVSRCNLVPVLKYFLQERDARFRLLAAKYANDQQFLAGWLQRDTDLTTFLSV